VIRKIKSEASDEDMIKNLHFMVELGRKINKALAAQAQVRAVPCSARLAGANFWRRQRSARLGELMARVPVTIRCPLHESGLKPLMEEAGA
jgi:hypothetical protein